MKVHARARLEDLRAAPLSPETLASLLDEDPIHEVYVPGGGDAVAKFVVETEDKLIVYTLDSFGWTRGKPTTADEAIYPALREMLRDEYVALGGGA